MMTAILRLRAHNRPILLYNDECGLCRRLAGWVERSGGLNHLEPRIEERPIGADPQALLALHPGLDIWDAYATIHLLMPDGSMRIGGEAVAEVLKALPQTGWLSRSFGASIFGVRPFQLLLNLAYAILSDLRPLLGCESCGTPSLWVRPIAAFVRWHQAHVRRWAQTASQPTLQRALERENLSRCLQAKVVTELHKDLMHLTPAAIVEQLRPALPL
jgi:hypothetical protein